MSDFEKNLKTVGYQITGADNHVKSRASRISQTPINNVYWDGERGASKCYPTDIETIRILQKSGQDYVKYNRTGEPDFKPFETASVKISDMTDNRQKNFGSADEKLLQTEWAKENNLHTKSDLENYRKTYRLTWHECSDGVTMRLVPTEINARFGHSGGVAEMKEMDSEINISENGLLRSVGQECGKATITVNKSLVDVEDTAKEINRDFCQGLDEVSADFKEVEKAVLGDLDLKHSLQNKIISEAKRTQNDLIIDAADVLNKAVDNVSSSLVNAAPELASNALNKARQVKDGTIGIEDAGLDFTCESAALVAKQSIRSEINKHVNNVVNDTACNVAEKITSKTITPAQVQKVAGIILALKGCTEKYINGEIDSGEYFIEIFEDGLGYAVRAFASFVGGAFGPLGAVIFEHVCGSAYDELVQASRNLRFSKKRLKEIEHVKDEILKKQHLYQEQIRFYSNAVYNVREEEFRVYGINTFISILNNDIDEFISSINSLGESLGFNLQFKSFEEFDEFMLDDEAIFVF